MDLQSSQHGESPSFNQSSVTIHAALPFFSTGSTQMGSQSNQKSSASLFMGKYETKEKMGSGKVGNSLSPKILWRHWITGSSAQQ